MKTNPSKKGKTMLFRLIGKLYFYFVVVPAIGRILQYMLDTYLSYTHHKALDPDWNMEKQRTHDAELRNRRRSRRAR